MKNQTTDANKDIVLVGVLKNKRDLRILLTERWYRIPVAHAPRRPFQYLAFYQPAIFGWQGKCIRYYARVVRRQITRRTNLLPTELHHPRAQDRYFRIGVGSIKQLHAPIKNITRRRISFGFTTLHRLLTAKEILQLYNVAPTEQIIARALQRVQIKATAQCGVGHGKKRYRLDFAVFCRDGAIAIECDNKKAHAGRLQRRHDRRIDIFLKRLGWAVIRLPERDIVSDLHGCIRRIKKAIRKFHGLKSTLSYPVV